MDNSTNELYTILKRNVDKNAIAMKRVNLSEIDIKDDRTIIYKGIELPLKNKAFKDLMNCLSLSNKSILRMKKISEGVSHKLIKLMREATLQLKNVEVILCMDGEKDIYRMFTSNKQFKMMPKSTTFDLVDKFMGFFSDTIIDHTWSTPGSYGIHIRFPGVEAALKSMPDEVFQFGLTFENSLDKGIIVSPYNNRLSCDNGMSTVSNMVNFKLERGADTDSYMRFYQGVISMKNNDFLAKPFLKKMKKALGTRASISELLYGVSVLTRYSNVGKDVDLYLPYEFEKQRYSSKRYDFAKMTEDQKKIAKSSITVADLINALTDFASHNYSYQVTDYQRTLIQTFAGNLLTKRSFDQEDLKLATLFD